MGLFSNNDNEKSNLTDQEKTDLIKDDHMRRARRETESDPDNVVGRAEYWAQQGHEPPANQQ